MGPVAERVATKRNSKNHTQLDFQLIESAHSGLTLDIFTCV